jgi:putative ABC transport system substrate-binding protein
MNIELEDKRLELPKEVRPHLSRPGVLWSPANPVNSATVSRVRSVAAMEAHRLPAVYPHVEYAELGGLAVDGANLSVLFERAAVYVDKILRGAKPGDLPVQQATELELIVNLKAAKALGLVNPPAILARATEVIE